MTREPITTSELGTYLSCPRKYYLRYVLRWSPATKSQALRFGSAWHTAMEARWHGADYETALNTALTTAGDEVDALMAAQLAGMLAGYYACYGAQDTTVKELYAEVPFEYALKGSKLYSCAGKIDGLGLCHDGEYCLIEHKSAGEDIGPDSDYWLRLKHNWQLFQYVTAARQHGWTITRIIYDVARKPSIKPSESAAVLDENGLKQVVDANGARVFKRDGTPKQTADKDKGEYVLTAPESMDAYAARLAEDCKTRPEFYFARREVPLFEEDIAQFEQTRLTLTKHITATKAMSRKCKRAEHAWPRACGAFTCRGCEFKTPCLEYATVDAGTVPVGFRVREAKHEELVVEE